MVNYTKVTISGQICTGKTTLFKALGKTLGWQTFSTGQFFRDYAAKHDLDIESAEEQNEEVTKKIDNQVRELLKTKDNIIVEGWLAGIMAHSIPKVLKVLLICQNSVRAKRFSNREEIVIKEAKDRVKERDTSWLEEINKIYQRTDVFESSHYDLVIDTSVLTPTQVLNKVLGCLNQNV